MRLIAIWTALCASLGCSDDAVSLTLELEYVRDSCNNVALTNAFFEQRGTVAVHVFDVRADAVLLGSDCEDLPEQAFRNLPDLPEILAEHIEIDSLPFGAEVRVQVEVYNQFVQCLPYRPDMDMIIPRYFGANTPAVVLTEEPAKVVVPMTCL